MTSDGARNWKELYIAGPLSHSLSPVLKTSHEHFPFVTGISTFFSLAHFWYRGPYLQSPAAHTSGRVALTSWTGQRWKALGNQLYGPNAEAPYKEEHKSLYEDSSHTFISLKLLRGLQTIALRLVSRFSNCWGPYPLQMKPLDLPPRCGPTPSLRVCSNTSSGLQT